MFQLTIRLLVILICSYCIFDRFYSEFYLRMRLDSMNGFVLHAASPTLPAMHFALVELFMLKCLF